MLCARSLNYHMSTFVHGHSRMYCSVNIRYNLSDLQCHHCPCAPVCMRACAVVEQAGDTGTVEAVVRHMHRKIPRRLRYSRTSALHFFLTLSCVLIWSSCNEMFWLLFAEFPSLVACERYGSKSRASSAVISCWLSLSRSVLICVCVVTGFVP